jgi:cytoskeletal protein RodZ
MRALHTASLAVAVAGLVAMGCTREAVPSTGTSTATSTSTSTSTSTATSTATSTSTSTATSTATSTSGPARPLEVGEAQALIPGAATPLAAADVTVVDPTASFRVVLKGRYPEARLSLLDGADALVPSAGAREAGPATTLSLQPSAPLRPGSRYRLRVDGANRREIPAEDGTLRQGVDWNLQAAGDPPAERSSAKGKKKPR